MKKIDSSATINNKTISNMVNALKDNESSVIHNLFLVHNKYEWLSHPIFPMTLEEINNVDEKGFIANKGGVDCYLTRFLPSS